MTLLLGPTPPRRFVEYFDPASFSGAIKSRLEPGYNMKSLEIVRPLAPPGAVSPLPAWNPRASIQANYAASQLPTPPGYLVVDQVLGQAVGTRLRCGEAC
jgi:hypothetical protein